MECHLEKEARPLLSSANLIETHSASLTPTHYPPRKDRMWDNFQRMAQQMGSGQFDFVPETFVLPQQLRSFKHRYLKTRRVETLQLAGMMGFWCFEFMETCGKKDRNYLQHFWVEI